uniref:Uncharacterized protein n=1 Tax=Solanum tuberosum TaxID=4113 RepID=M1D7C4_SOLTU
MTHERKCCHFEHLHPRVSCNVADAKLQFSIYFLCTGGCEIDQVYGQVSLVSDNQLSENVSTDDVDRKQESRG